MVPTELSIPDHVSTSLTHKLGEILTAQEYSEGRESLLVTTTTLEERVSLLFAAQHDLAFRAKFNAACARDACFFINNCLHIFEPRASDSERELPFLLRPFQEDFVRSVESAIDNGHDLVVEKSREMGATWLMLAIMLHRWLFERQFTGKMGSITRDKVDKKGDWDTLFSKLDYMAESLKIFTPWLYPAGYKSDQPTRTYMKMVNPVNGSVLSGEPSGPDFGRSGRQKMFFLDEFAKWPFGHSSWTACSKSSDCHVAVSTPAGMGNLFARLANPKDTKYQIPKITLLWESDPTKAYWDIDQESGEKVQPWLELQKAIYAYDPTMLAQEIFIDYGRSVEGQVYPQIFKSRMGFFDYDPDLPLYTSWDFGVRDFCAILWIQFDPISGRFRVIDAFQHSGKAILWYVPFLTGDDLALGDNDGGYTPEQLTIINRHSGFEYSAHFGDPTGKNRNHVTATSVFYELAKQGITIQSKEFKKDSWEEARAATQKFLLLADIDQRYCEDFVEAITNSRYPKESEKSEAVSIQNRPVHDEFSHYRSSLEMFTINSKHLRRRMQEDVQNVAIPQTGAGFFGDTKKFMRYLEGSSSSHYARHRKRRGNAGY